jgi:ABC-type dipeptide/oligopeptide/nickel transport system permease subunit
MAEHALPQRAKWTTEIQAETERRRAQAEFWRRYSRNRLAVVGLFLAGVMLFTGVFAPWLAPYSPTEQNLHNTEQMPSLAHPLGTDLYGRDQLSRIIWGARTALIVAPSATIISTLLGLFFGSIAGYFGGLIDSLVMRLVDVVGAFPGILFTILIAATIQPRVESWLKGFAALKGLVEAGYASFLVVVLALSLVGWSGLARLLRGQILTVREQLYVEAARAIGLPAGRIITRHLLPNAMAPIIVSLSFSMGGAILAETGLSFLGIGIRPPTPSWGAMIFENYVFWRQPTAFVLLWIPGLVVASLIFAFSFIGDGLNDALNPQLD